MCRNVEKQLKSKQEMSLSQKSEIEHTSVYIRVLQNLPPNVNNNEPSHDEVLETKE